MSVGTDSSKEVLLCAVNCNGDAVGNATTSRIGEDETAQGRQGDKARAIEKQASEIERGKKIKDLAHRRSQKNSVCDSSY